MKTVGLLSGGKDSVFNLLHCSLQRNTPVALATLAPESGKDEIDSYMYQTVGNSGISSIANALRLPLFTHHISGSPIHIEGEYGSREGSGSRDSMQEAGGSETGEGKDETEDLYELLRKVQMAIPDIEAVASGAILSNYQRIRVEHVCSRLGLASLAYLWERNQKELLHEMVEAGMESVLVKVAGAGLGVKHLGKTLAEMEPTLHRLNDTYDLHICGEGGEYETFTIDCPLFHDRISLDKTTTVISNSDPYSTVAHLHLDSCSLAPKADYPTIESTAEMVERLRRLVTVPKLLDEESEVLLEDVERALVDTEVEESKLPVELEELVRLHVGDGVKRRGPAVSKVGEWIGFSQITGRNPDASEITIEEEMQNCFHQLSLLLSPHCPPSPLLSITHLTLYLSSASMPLFPRLNKIYATFFGSAPPTRACVAVLLPSSTVAPRMILEGIAWVPEKAGALGGRKSLHVQSISYWAAANIGPYSQTISHPTRTYLAGQIGLIPSSLTLPPRTTSSFATEVVLSLQHTRRVIAASEREGRWKGWCEGGVGWIASGGEGEWGRRLRAARRGWEGFGVMGGNGATTTTTAPMIFVEAVELPKGALVEWQFTFGTRWTGRKVRNGLGEEGDDDDDGEGDEDLVARQICGREVVNLEEPGGGTVISEISKSDEGVEFVALVATTSSSSPLPATTLFTSSQLHLIRAFHLPTVSASTIHRLLLELLNLSPTTTPDQLPALSLVPTRHLATLSHDGVQVAFLVVGTKDA